MQTQEASMINTRTNTILELWERRELTCKIHGKRVIHAIKGQERIRCDLCLEGEEKAKLEAEKAREERRIAEGRRLRIEQNFKQAMIPPRFQNHSFETFEAKTPEQQKNKKAMMEFTAAFNDGNGAAAILCGSVGTGKTHLACAAANFIIKNFNKTAIFLNTIDAFSQIKATYSKNSKTSEIEALNRFCEIDLLVLDEFGVGMGSEHEKMLLFRIINRRYEYMKPTIVITNLSVGEIESFEKRTFDRLRHEGILLTFTEKSQRKARKI